MTIDENTGLPELPEGYFWRVKADSAGTRVHRMRKRKLLPATSTGSSYIFPHLHGTVEQSIKRAARDVLNDNNNEESLRTYKGDYPPNKLEK